MGGFGSAPSSQPAAPRADVHANGDLLPAPHRHPFRPAHLYFVGFKAGFKITITQIFVDDDEHLGSEVVFASPKISLASMSVTTRMRRRSRLM